MTKQPDANHDQFWDNTTKFILGKYIDKHGVITVKVYDLETVRRLQTRGWKVTTSELSELI